MRTPRYIFVLFVFSCSCAEETDQKTDEITVSGDWSGIATSATDGNEVAFDATLTQDGENISGTISFNGGNGSLSGSISGSNVQLTMQAECVSEFDLTLNQKGTQLTGYYADVATASCSAEEGTILMDKQ